MRLFMNACGGKIRTRRYTRTFFCAYFLYYAGYALFSSYMVSYLTQRGMSATICGIVTSLTLFMNVCIQPIAGYLTDTCLEIKRYLTLSIAAVCLFGFMTTGFASNNLVSIILIVISAAFSYPFIQLMDAWVNCSGEVDDQLVYSRVRAGGSIGFAVASMAAGYYFHAYGYGNYFLLQAACFLAILPLLYRLPALPMGNCRTSSCKEQPRVNFFQSFAILLRIPQYTACLLLFSLYWMSHRSIGSYLALITDLYGGGDRLFGNVCGVGAVVESLMLLIVAKLNRHFSLRQILTGSILLCAVRPMLLQTGSVPLLYIGQIVQSVSFALYFTASTACFTKFADPRIRGFSISVGLTSVSVIGTVCANFIGGMLFDLHGVARCIDMSLLLSAVNVLVFVLFSNILFGKED